MYRPTVGPGPPKWSGGKQYGSIGSTGQRLLELLEARAVTATNQPVILSGVAWVQGAASSFFGEALIDLILQAVSYAIYLFLSPSLSDAFFAQGPSNALPITLTCTTLVFIFAY